MRFSRREWGIVGVVVLLVLAFRACGSVPQTSKRQAAPARVSSPPAQARLRLTVQRTEYDYGFFKLEGIAENIGDADAFSPTINLYIYDETGRTLLADDATWPVGQYLTRMPPGQSAAFQHIVSVPSGYGKIRWEIRVKEFPFEFVDARRK
jgi:hypothetical protein